MDGQMQIDEGLYSRQLWVWTSSLCFHVWIHHPSDDMANFTQERQMSMLLIPLTVRVRANRTFPNFSATVPLLVILVLDALKLLLKN